MTDHHAVVMPSLAELVSVLEEISGTTDLRTDLRLAELGVDSMDLLEWLFTLEERLSIEFDALIEEEAELEAFGDLTLADLYDALVDLVRQARVDASATP
jgi:acyl carrier protein